MSNFKMWLKRTGLSRNTAPKIASLIFALVLWIYVMDIENPEIIRSFDNIPIELVNVEQVESNGLLLANPTDLTVNLKLKGRRSELLGLTLKDIHVTADLYGAVKGYNSIPLNFEIDNDNVYMTNASRRDMNLYLDKIVELPKKVNIRITGTLPEGYSSGDLEVTPQEVLVRGPEKLVNEVARLVGDLDISDLKKDLLKEIPIIAVDNDGNVVQGVEVKTVYVNAGIGVYKILEYPILLNITGEVANGYRVTASVANPDSLRVMGKEESMPSGTSGIPLSVDVAGLTDSFEVNLPLKLAEGIKSIDLVESVIVKVTIEKIITASYTYDFKDISFLNMSSAVSVEDQNQQIVVRVEGVESVINSITKEDINLQVDLVDLEVGAYQLPLSLKTVRVVDQLDADIQEVNIQLIAK